MSTLHKALTAQRHLIAAGLDPEFVSARVQECAAMLDAGDIDDVVRHIATHAPPNARSGAAGPEGEASSNKWDTIRQRVQAERATTRRGPSAEERLGMDKGAA